MVNFYVYRIINGTKKWTDIPKLWKQSVIDELISKGYTTNSDGTVSKNDVAVE